MSGMQRGMILSSVFERFVKQSAVSVMARAAMEHALAPEALDALFAEHADSQYTRDLLFSSVVDLMGVVVCRIAPSICAAYQAVADTLPVSITSVYNKLNGLEPAVTRAMVSHTADRLEPVIVAMGGRCPIGLRATVFGSWMAITWLPPNGVWRCCVAAWRVRCPDMRSWCWTRR